MNVLTLWCPNKSARSGHITKLKITLKLCDFFKKRLWFHLKICRMLSGNKFYVDMTSSVHLGMIKTNRKVVQKGVLEATPSSLVFTDDVSQAKQLWPLKSLRNIEASSNKVFVIETTDPSMDTQVFSFSTPEAKQLQNLVLNHLRVMIRSEQPHQLSGTHSAVSNSPISPQTRPVTVDETGPIHWKLNTRLSMDSSSSSSTISPTHSRVSSISRDIFEVDRILEDSSKKEHGTLEATENEIVFVECGGGGKRIAWPFKCLRRYGYEGDIFTLEVGRKAPGGEGRHKFKALRAAELNAAIKTTSVASIGRNTPPSPANAEKIGKVQHAQQFSFASPTHRALPPPPSLPPLPHLPSQATHLLPSKHAPLPPTPSQPLLPPPIPIQQHRYSHHSMSPPKMRDIESESQKLSLSSPAFNQPDSLVRRSHSIHDLRRNIFEVRNISDDKKEVGQGTVEVTSTDLIYIDSNTHEKWKWPVRFLRKYGYEENIFSFEAGRRCPGGQGLYAFVSERASEIHGTILESVRDQGKQGSVPARAPLTPQHVRSATQNQIKRSLVDDQGLPPVTKLSNKNHYNDNSRNVLMKTGLVRQQSPTLNLATSLIVQKTTPNSIERSVSPLNSSNVIVEPSSTSGKISPNATIPPQQAKTHGKPRNHHYDTMAIFDTEPSTRDSDNQPAVIVMNINNKKSSLPNLNSEQSRSTAYQKKRNSKSEQKRVSESNPDDDDAAILGDVAKDVMHKPRSKVLSRLIGKKLKKVKRESVGGLIVDQSFNRVDSSDTYVNIQHGVARSASCDNILNSCSTFDSHSTDTSAVPLPPMFQSQTPPTNRRQCENGYRYPEQKPIPVPSSSAVLYQNLKDVGSSIDQSHLDTPPAQSNDYPHLYSNVSSLAEHNYENQPLPNRTMYAELEIRPMTTPPPSVSPHGSPRLLPQPYSPYLNTGGRITITSPLLTKLKPPLKANQVSDRQQSITMLPAAVAPTEPHQSTHIRPQSESSSHNCITSSYEVDGGQIGVASVENGDNVVYSPLDFAAINAVAQIKRDHADIRNFDEILKRHDIREMEMDRKKRKNILT